MWLVPRPHYLNSKGLEVSGLSNVSCLLLIFFSFSWGKVYIDVHYGIVLFVPSKSLFPQSCVSSVIKSHWPPKSNSLGVLSPFARSPGWKSVVGPRTFFTVREFLWHNCPSVCGLSAWWLCGQVNGNLIQEGFCHRLCDQVAALRAPAPVAGHCWPIPPQETQTQVWMLVSNLAASCSDCLICIFCI